MDTNVLNSKPRPMPVLAEHIPEALRPLGRWVNWRWEWNGKKWTKPLYDPRTGRHASSTDPATWNDLSTVLAAHRRGLFDGIGITLGKLEDGRTLAGVDLDGVREPETGAIAEWAGWVVRRLDSYAEVSPSWTGVKAMCWGQVPTGRKADHERGVEMYDSGRYWTVTGHTLDDVPADIMPRAEVLRQLHAELLGDAPSAGGQHRDDRELALSALAALAAWRAVGYYDWLAVGMALHSVDQSGGMQAEWDRWSHLAPEKYQDGACARKWASFGRGGLTLGSLIHWAREDGWSPPWERTALAEPSAEEALAAVKKLSRSIRAVIRSDAMERHAWQQALAGKEGGEPCV